MLLLVLIIWFYVVTAARLSYISPCVVMQMFTCTTITSAVLAVVALVSSVAAVADATVVATPCAPIMGVSLCSVLLECRIAGAVAMVVDVAAAAPAAVVAATRSLGSISEGSQPLRARA